MSGRCTAGIPRNEDTVSVVSIAIRGQRAGSTTYTYVQTVDVGAHRTAMLRNARPTSAAG